MCPHQPYNTRSTTPIQMSIQAHQSRDLSLRAHLNALIAKRKLDPFGDDLLTRLIRAKTLDDDSVRRNITGIIVGAIDTTSDRRPKR